MSSSHYGSIEVRDSPFPKYFRQLKVVLNKNFILAKRNKKLTMMQFGCPVLFVFLLFLMGLIPNYGGPIGEQPVFSINTVPTCIPGKEFGKCYSLMFGPSEDPTVMEIMGIISDNANLSIHFSDGAVDADSFPSGSIVGLRTFEELEKFVLDHQNYTQAVLYFNASATDFDSSGLPEYDEDSEGIINYQSTWNATYEMWYNNTCTNALINPSIDFAAFTDPVASCPDIRPQLQLATDCAIIDYLLGDSVNVSARCDANLQSFYWADLGVSDTVQQYGVLFFFCAMMFVYVVLIYQVVYEKDKNLKLGMQLMGLKESVFWVTWFLTALLTSFIVILLVMTTGYIFQFAYFLQTNFMINFITFFLFSLAMIGLSLMVSVMVGSAKQAISIGMFLYIIGVLIQIFLQNQEFVAFIYTHDLLVSNILRPFFLVYPPFNFAKVVLSISQLSFDKGAYKGTGYGWDNLDDVVIISNEEIPTDFESWGWLVIDCVIYYSLAWYLSNILPSDTSSGSPPWFFLTPTYWGFSRTSDAERYQELISSNSKHSDFDDVANSRPAIEIKDVVKVHYKYPFGIRSGSDVLAVSGLNLNINQGELFCLLGHNGAGKTTTINMMTGLYQPTEGSISIFDKDIVSDLDEIRSQIGICPQHDILWGEMTAEEHLYLYSRMKDLKEEDVPMTVQKTLEHVNLLHKKDIRSSNFSGGMKRRLSVAISSIGDPKVIFMDEPTTGMDPKSRQQVWKMIEELKEGRVIIMTTHSMEEAEMLSDRVGIMTTGSLCCVGTSLYLKSNYGTGYKLTLMIDESNLQKVEFEIQRWLPKAHLETTSGGQLTYTLQECSPKEIVNLVRYLEDQVEATAKVEDESQILFKDWSISQSGLEDVFLKVTGHDSAGKSNVIDYDNEL